MKAVAKWALGALAALCMAGGGSALADTFTFSMIPSPQTVTPGGTASVDIYLIDTGGTQIHDQNGLASATFDINRTAAIAGPADITSVTANSTDFDGIASGIGSGPSGNVSESVFPLDPSGVMPGLNGVFLGSFAVTVPGNTATGSTTFTISAEPDGFTTFGTFDQNGNLTNFSTLNVTSADVTFDYTGNPGNNVAPLPGSAEMGLGMFAFVGLLAFRRRLGLIKARA